MVFYKLGKQNFGKSTQPSKTGIKTNPQSGTCIATMYENAFERLSRIRLLMLACMFK